MSSYAPAADRFWAKVDLTGGADACWLWLAAKHPAGYGNFRGEGGRYLSAHHQAWEFLVGPLELGTELDHLCRTPACVNPRHLEVVTHAENIRRAGVVVRTGFCERGHDQAIHGYVRKDRPGGNCRECRRELRAGRR